MCHPRDDDDLAQMIANDIAMFVARFVIAGSLGCFLIGIVAGALLL